MKRLQALPLLPFLLSPLALAGQNEAIQVAPAPQVPNAAEGVPGQQALPPAAMDLSGLAFGLLFDQPGDGHVWASSPGWKASFGPSGYTFIPFLGSDAPQNYPLNLRLDQVTLQGEELFPERPGAPQLEGQI